MRVLPRKAASPIRQMVEQPKTDALAHTFPAPIRGLVLNENIATAGPAGAQVLDNWICTPTGIRPRSGSQRYATLPGAVTAIFAYRSTGGKLFAATETAIHDISSSVDPMGAALAVPDQTGGSYSHTMFGTAGGDFLIVVNGQDDPLMFDGLAWTNPAITGATPANLTHVWSYANRLFFTEKNSLTAHFLPVDSIAGEAAPLSLSGVFKLGGSLLFGATWSMDAGDGLDDKCVIVSTEGEVAVYEGTNPASATDWRLAGVYQITRPLGKNATMRAGGDLLIATESGLVPLSQVVQKDPAALSMAAVSLAVAPLWAESAAHYDLPWSIVKWPEKGIMLVGMATEVEDDVTLCCSLQTGGWSRWTNLGARCLEYFGGYVFAGGNDGIVRRLETGGSDMGQIYTAVYVGAHEALGAPGVQKTALQARSLFRASHQVNPQVTVQTDYVVEISSPPAAASYQVVGLWDQSVWDESIWDGGTAATAMTSYWRSIGRTGYSIAPELQVSFGNQAPPNVELVSIDMTYTTGALVA